MSKLFCADSAFTVLPFQDHELDKILQLPDDPQIVVAWDTDSIVPIRKFKHLKIYRTSLLRSRRSPNEYALPAHLNYSFCVNFRHSNTQPLPGVHHDRPRVGFCGNGAYSVRRQVNQAFRLDPRVDTQIIDTKVFIKRISDKARCYEQFERVMRDNSFILCCRGAGNWSIRFYETMCAGRIPVLLDTDVVLPKDDRIDWHTLIVMDSDPRRLVDKVVDWNCRGREFVCGKQRCIFEAWRTHLRPHVFFQN